MNKTDFGRDVFAATEAVHLAKNWAGSKHLCYGCRPCRADYCRGEEVVKPVSDIGVPMISKSGTNHGKTSCAASSWNFKNRAVDGCVGTSSQTSRGFSSAPRIARPAVFPANVDVQVVPSSDVVILRRRGNR